MKPSIFLLLSLLAISSAQETGAKYLIITYDDYYDAILPLADWKTQKGVKAKLVKLSQVGYDSTQIRNYIVNAYNTWQLKPEFLLLVGNKSQMPFPRLREQFLNSDNYYTNVTGDFKNEIIPGRFWTFDVNDVRTIVNKILNYEKTPYFGDSLWYRRGVTIVNEDQDSLPADSVYWSDARYAHSLMNNAGFFHIDSLAESFGHDSTDLINTFNTGRSYMLYRGVGFHVWDVPFMGLWLDQLNNSYMLPVVISATCATVEGIGYEWLNAGTPTEAKGTVGFFGTTTALFHAAEMRSALTRGSLESIFTDSLTTLGRAAEAGRLNYYNEFNDSSEYNAWTCLGDPEMTLWTSTPKQISVQHDSVLWVPNASETITVNVQCNSVPVESAFVCMMAKKDTTIYKYGRTDNAGNITLIDTFQIPGDSVLITVSGRNLEPYIGIAQTYLTGEPFVLLNSFSISDSTGGNADSVTNPGENIEIPVWLKNFGGLTAYDVSAVIRKQVTDTFITLDDTIKMFGDIASGDSAFSSNDGYNAIIAPDCPDSHRIMLEIIIKDTNDSTWQSDFDFTVHAPIILFNKYFFPGLVMYTQAGDTSDLIIELENAGSYKAENISGKIFSGDSFFMAIDSIATFGTIGSDSIGSNQSNPFIITTDPQTPPSYPLGIKMEIISGVYIDTLSFTVYVGQKDYLIWDPDMNHSSGPFIKAILDSLGFFGDYKIATIPHNDIISLYKSLFICCGMRPDNYVVKDTSWVVQQIQRYLAVFNGKLYLEGGDVWYDDPHFRNGYDFSPLFNILPVSTNVGPFPNVLGIDSTFTESMDFDCTDDQISVDRINQSGNGILIFKSAVTDYGCGVAANHKTVGLSFEIGGLVNNAPPSIRTVLIDSIMRYFGIPSTGITETQEYLPAMKHSISIYPNPCYGKIKIKYSLGATDSKKAKLKIYDITGRLVKDLLLSTPYSPGLAPQGGAGLLPTVISWDGIDDHQRKVPCGIYFVKLETKAFTEIKKVILLK